MNVPSNESPRQDVPPSVAKTLVSSLPDTVQAQDFERSLAELSDARSAASGKGHMEEWAELTVRLGDTYSGRRVGPKSENLNLAIECYEGALTVYDLQRFPKERILCHHGLGRAYHQLCEGRDRLIKELSLVHYQMALALITKVSWPSLWHTLHLGVALLFLEHGQDEDAKLSDEHYRIAFDLDRDQWPELYDTMKKLYNLHLRRLELLSELEAVRGASADACGESSM
jgi:hypothetical protein